MSNVYQQLDNATRLHARFMVNTLPSLGLHRAQGQLLQTARRSGQAQPVSPSRPQYQSALGSLRRLQ